MYAKIEDDKIVKTGPHPGWSNDSGALATDEEMIERGWYPVHDSPPSYDPEAQRLVRLPVSEWPIEKSRVVVAYRVDDIPLEELRDLRMSEATAMRWEIMTGGLTLPGGVVVGTDIDDQNRITSVVANAELAGLTDADEVDFKAVSGWVRITIAEVKAIAGHIGQFVQACYSAERAHHESIEALETREQVRDYDTGQGWPLAEIFPVEGQ